MSKIEEFINIKQGSMNVREYSLKFLKLSRYATSLVSNNRDEMCRFLIGFLEDLEEECRSAILHDSMDLSRVMVHVKKVEDSRKMRRVCDLRSPNPSDKIGSSRGGGRSTFGVRDQPRSNKGR